MVRDMWRTEKWGERKSGEVDTSIKGGKPRRLSQSRGWTSAHLKVALCLQPGRGSRLRRQGVKALRH